MFINTTYRSQEIEIMDNLEMSGDLLIKTLDQISNINKWLGGNKLTIDGVKILLNNHSKKKTYRIIDLGCGNGDMLREIADFGKKNGYTFQLHGVDANQATINYAMQLSVNYPEITFQKKDILSREFKTESYDIALCTLFLHHFEDKVIVNIIQNLIDKANLGIVINDLHRHPVAYYLFKALSLFIRNEMVKQDGLISILRGFKRKELEDFSKKIQFNRTISWRWAFRYQWIISKS